MIDGIFQNPNGRSLQVEDLQNQMFSRPACRDAVLNDRGILKRIRIVLVQLKTRRDRSDRSWFMTGCDNETAEKSRSKNLEAEFHRFPLSLKHMPGPER